MSVENNAFRTIDGVNEILTDRINIVEALELNGDDGLANQFIKVNPDGISQGWGYVGTADLPNNIPLSKLENMPTLTIQKNAVNVGTYNPKTDSDKNINIAVPIETLEATQPLIVANIGTNHIIALSKDDATIIKNVSNQLEVGNVPFSKLTIADGDIAFAKLTIEDGDIVFDKLTIEDGDIDFDKLTIEDGQIDISKLAENKISGISLGGDLATLTAGSHITFSGAGAGTTYDGGTPLTINSANDNTLPAAGANISISGAGGNVVNLDFTSGGDIGFSNLAASPTNIYATNMKPTNLEVSSNAVCNILTATEAINSPLINVGTHRGDEVIMYRTAFTTETEWFIDVFYTGGSNDSFVNSCWFFGNKEEYTLTPTNWKIYAAGSGSGKTGGFNTYSHAKNDKIGTGSAAILYSKSYMDLSSITKITFSVIKGNDINGGEATTSADDLFLIWNNGVGGTGFQTFPTTSSATTGDYHYKLMDGGDGVATSWSNFTFDLSTNFSATGLTNFNNANRIAFYATDTNGQYGITNIQFKGLSKPVNKKIDNVSSINNRNFLIGDDYRASLSYYSVGSFANGWYYEPLDMSKFILDDDSNTPSSMGVYEFGVSNPSTPVYESKGLVSNGNHTQAYYLFDCPEGYYIEGYYVSLINRTNNAYLGMVPSSSLYNHLIRYSEGSNGASEIISEATTTGGAISFGGSVSYSAFNREVGVKQRLVYSRGGTFGGSSEYGYRASLNLSKKYAIMCLYSAKFPNTFVFRGGYIKYSRDS
jgi:hypothetical protein